MVNNFTKILIAVSFLFLVSGILSKNVFGSTVYTQSILRQTPPSPPTPPTKPEPPIPPPYCDDPGCFTPTPTPTPMPRPSESPTPTPMPTQPPAGGENGGTGGAPFQLGGPPPPPSVAGQVLGATTLGATGNFSENLFYLIFILGATFSSWGIMKYVPKKV